MTTFYELSFFMRSLFGLWSFLTCCVGIIGIILSFTIRRYRYALLAVVSFVPSYFMWQVIFNLYRAKKGELIAPASVSAKLGAFPWFVWFVAFLLITLAALWTIHLAIGYSRTYITPFAIKQGGDKMTNGVCYWLESGRVIFSNRSMNHLCLALTGEQLLNGNIFKDAVSDNIQQIGEKVWKITFRDMTYNGRLLHEMVAWDVTETHAKTEALQHDREELVRMTEELKAYSLKIDDVVRRQEILQAKINIHDEMNHLMLSTVATDKKDTEELDKIFTQWQRNALLLCMEAEEKVKQSAEDKLEQLAQLLEITLNIRGNLPSTMTEKQRELFYNAAQEAIVNAVKHGEAQNIEIFFAESETEILCTFENDGNINVGKVQFTGGLANLSLLAEEQNGYLSAETGETFTLALHFLKKCEKDMPIGTCENIK